MATGLPLIHRQDVFGHWYGLVISLGLAIVIIFLVGLTRWLLKLRWLLTAPAVILELTPPAAEDKLPLATQQLFTVLHGLHSARSWRDKLLGYRILLSLEIVSTRAQGIRYLIRVNQNQATLVSQAINSYLPEVKIHSTQDYLMDQAAANSKLRVIGFRQSGHFAYPLANHTSLDKHDPVAYLTGAMTKLGPSELMAFQLVLSPCRLAAARRIQKKISAGSDGLAQLQRGYGLALVGRALLLILRLPVKLIGGFIRNFIFINAGPSRHLSKSPRSKTLSYVEQLVVESVSQKLSQPLFQASMRALLISDSKRRQAERTGALSSSLATFSLAGHQSLKARSSLPGLLLPQYRLLGFGKRLPALFLARPLVLSSLEAAAIYHFPNSEAAKTENVARSLSRSLAAPISLKASQPPDIILGMNHYHGAITPIGLTAAERERHVYIVGGTGSGKSTMLLGGIIQDIKHGKGLALIDPHGDLSETILRHIPAARQADVVYFNPDDLDYPIGLNLLELAPGLSGNELRREKDMVTEAVVSVFRKVFSDDDSGGHRIEYVLRNSVHTALTLKDSTLFTVYELLVNPVFRSKAVAQLDDGNLKNFWRHEFGMAGAYQKVKMIHGITSKIGRFERSASAQPIMSQPRSTIDFDEIMDSGKILICNLSKGRLGEDTSTLFGTTLLAKLQMAALRRARQRPNSRRAFYLYVDEFQNFATTAFVQMLSEARKYKLFLSMAEQSTSQQEELRLVNIILANVGTVITFRSGSPLDERMLLPLFRPYLGAGEIANLPAYSFYIRISALKSQEPLSGETILINDSGSEAVAKRVISSSRQRYTGKPPTLEASEKTIPKIEVAVLKPKTIYPGLIKPGQS